MSVDMVAQVSIYKIVLLSLEAVCLSKSHPHSHPPIFDCCLLGSGAARFAAPVYTLGAF